VPRCRRGWDEARGERRTQFVSPFGMQIRAKETNDGESIMG
jgi:hypothetical protein